MSIRTYSEMCQYDNFKDRFDYLKCNGKVSEATFGFERYLNQEFYRTKEWEKIRDQVIIRDDGCDLGIKGCEIVGPIFIHHINPITKSDILNRTDRLTNLDYLVCTSKQTHDAIHYGNFDSAFKYDITKRTAGDTCLWRKD